MDVAAFYTQIGNAIRRPKETGNIASWASEAAMLIEQRTSYSWMKKFGEFDLDPLAATPNQVEFPNARVKSVKFARLFEVATDSSRGFKELQGVSPDRVSSIDLGDPNGFWLDGISHLWLDTRVTQERSLQLYWVEYTDWPTDTAASPTILQKALPLLKAETLLLAAMELRDPRLVEIYGARQQNALNALETAEKEFEWGHQQQMRVQTYVAPHTWRG